MNKCGCLVAGRDDVNVGGGTHTASRRRRAGSTDNGRRRSRRDAARDVDEDAVVDDGGIDGAGHGEPDGERQRDVRLPEEHAQPEGRPRRVARYENRVLHIILQLHHLSSARR